MTKKIKTQWRQGDLLIERVDKIPTGLKNQEGTILAHGEVTGHCHEIEDRESVVFDARLENETVAVKFAQLTSDSRVVHQEHAPIALKRGAYKITRQREYAPEAIRQVAD